MCDIIPLVSAKGVLLYQENNPAHESVVSTTIKSGKLSRGLTSSKTQSSTFTDLCAVAFSDKAAPFLWAFEAVVTRFVPQLLQQSCIFQSPGLLFNVSVS